MKLYKSCLYSVIVIVYKIVLIMTFTVTNKYAQTSNVFEEFNARLNSCALDSARYYLNKQKSIAQSSQEIFKNEINTIELYKKQKLLDSAFLLIDKLENKGLNRSNKGILYHQKGTLFAMKNDLEKAEDYYRKVLNLNSDYSLKLDVYQSLFVINTLSGKIDSAQYYLYKAKEIAEKDDLSFGKAKVFNSLGIFYFNQVKLDSSLVYLLKSLNAFSLLNDGKRRLTFYKNSENNTVSLLMSDKERLHNVLN